MLYRCSRKQRQAQKYDSFTALDVVFRVLRFFFAAVAAALLPDRISMSKRSGEVIADGVHSCLQKRLRFSSMVFMSLSNAIESWENARKNMALHPLPMVNILASVVKWGVPKKCRGIIT